MRHELFKNCRKKISSQKVQYTQGLTFHARNNQANKQTLSFLCIIIITFQVYLKSPPRACKGKTTFITSYCFLPCVSNPRLVCDLHSKNGSGISVQDCNYRSLLAVSVGLNLAPLCNSPRATSGD